MKAAPRHHVKRKVVRTVSRAPQSVTVTTQLPPVPLPAPLAAAEMPVMSGGGGAPVVLAGGGGFGGGISELNISRDGRTLFFRERDGIYSVPLSAAAAAT